MIPGGGGFGSGRGLLLIAGLALAGWLATGFYTVKPNEVGIETIFGRYVGQKGEGLRYNFPYPIGGVVKPNVGQVNSIQIGYRAGVGRARGSDMPEESLMLTADENIVDLDFEVQWRVNPLKASDYVFNLQNPEGTIKAIAESAMREVVGRRNIQAILTNEQSSVAQEVKEIKTKAELALSAGEEIFTQSEVDELITAAVEKAVARAKAHADEPLRKRMPRERQSLTHKFSLGGHEGYITAGMYEDGTVGEIAIRGDNVMKGYWDNPEATAEAIPDGWFRTGDMATRDEEGYYTIVDRKKDMILRGGMNVYPREVEEVIYTHPDVVEVAVVGMPDDLMGEQVGAAVALREGATATPQDIIDFTKERIAAYKYPRKVWVVPELPKGPTGKILRREVHAPDGE